VYIPFLPLKGLIPDLIEIPAPVRKQIFLPSIKGLSSTSPIFWLALKSGRPAIEGIVKRGKFSPAKPIFRKPEPLSQMTLVVSTTESCILDCKRFL
jgi:hypothetical protein